MSIVILVVVIFGGMGNIVGVIAGSVVLIGVLGGPKQPGLLAEFSEFKLLIYGALLVWMMLARPEGLIPERAPLPTSSTSRSWPRMPGSPAPPPTTITVMITPRNRPQQHERCQPRRAPAVSLASSISPGRS